MAKNSKAVQVLALIESTGTKGMRFTDIQRVAFALTHPGKKFTRKNRGFWASNLAGKGKYHGLNSYTNHIPTDLGLLGRFCTKNEEGRWVRNEVQHNGHPYAK